MMLEKLFFSKKLVHFPSYFFELELLLFLVVSILSIIIFYRTKNIYDLTKHKGIHYFRSTFLYFAINCFLRFLFILTILFEELFEFSFELFEQVDIIILILLTYFSTLASFSLILTIFSKKINKPINEINTLIHVFSLITTVLVYLTRTHNTLILVQLILLGVSVIYLLFENTKKNKFLSFNQTTFLLMMSFWVIKLFTNSETRIAFELRGVLYLFSIIIFILIFLKVHKRLKT